MGQKSIDDVVVTGEVSKIVLCHHEDEIWDYRLQVRLHAKNVGSRSVIISGATALPDYYKVATTLDSLGSQEYSHIGWVTSGPQPEPKTVPEKPVRPFRVVAANESVDIDVDLRAGVVGELKSGPAFLKVVAENWPEYSDDYVAKLRKNWSSFGLLWAHSLHSETIAFVVPRNLRKGRCP